MTDEERGFLGRVRKLAAEIDTVARAMEREGSISGEGLAKLDRKGGSIQSLATQGMLGRFYG